MLRIQNACKHFLLRVAGTGGCDYGPNVRLVKGEYAVTSLSRCSCVQVRIKLNTCFGDAQGYSGRRAFLRLREMAMIRSFRAPQAAAWKVEGMSEDEVDFKAQLGVGSREVAV